MEWRFGNPLTTKPSCWRLTVRLLDCPFAVAWAPRAREGRGVNENHPRSSTSDANPTYLELKKHGTKSREHRPCSDYVLPIYAYFCRKVFLKVSSLLHPCPRRFNGIGYATHWQVSRVKFSKFLELVNDRTSAQTNGKSILTIRLVKT